MQNVQKELEKNNAFELSIIIPVVEVTKLRHRKVKYLAQGHETLSPYSSAEVTCC